MEFVPMLVILATTKKTVDFVKYVKTGDVNGVLTQILAWAAGFAVVALAAQTPWAAGLIFGGVALSKLGIAAQLFVGIAVGSTTSAALVDAGKVFDNTQSAATPPLVGPQHRRPSA